MSIIATEKPVGRKRNRSLKDYAGQRYGRLVALQLVERDPLWNAHRWLFACDCGAEKVASIKSVTAGKTSSCGCRFTEALVARNTTHGLSQANRREYRSWKDARSRCNNPADSDFRDYGGRGIRFCPRWDRFENFLSDMGARAPGMTLDRVDVNGNYEPGNCRWADAKTQANNKRANHVIAFGGEEKTLQGWCDKFGVDPGKARWRLKQGWSLDRVFSTTDHRKR